MTVPTIDLKRGDTLALDCQALEGLDGPPRDLTGWGIRSQVRSSFGARLASLVVLIEDAADGRYSLRAEPPTTAAWPLGQARMDIEYTDPDGIVQSTETVLVSVLPDETQ